MALANERISEEEGLWIDQLCIDQRNKEEKGVAIAAMDVIYRGARVVVVALADVEISWDKQTFLRGYISDYEDPIRPEIDFPHINEAPLYMSRNPLFRNIFYKIMSSR